MAATATFTVRGGVTKRMKLIHKSNGQKSSSSSSSSSQPLIPGLPDHIAQLCLFSLHPSLLYSVSRSWRRLLYSSSFPPFLSLYALLSSSSSSSSSSSDDRNPQFQSSPIKFFSFDPISSIWQTLPPPPPDPPLHLLHRHPSFISRNLPIQSVVVSGNLILLAATTHHFLPALSRPLIFNPLSLTWSFGPPLSTPRRWCAAGASDGAVYVGSGIGSHYSIDVARSVEKWNFRCVNSPNRSSESESESEWEKMKMLRDGRFSRDAIEAVGYRGKLYMVNVKGDAAKEGVVYDIAKNEWEEMPEGMRNGWRGPVGAMDEDVMYAVDEAKGGLRRYDPDKDGWDEIMKSEKLKDAEHISAGGGRVCIVCGGDGGIVVVDVVASPPKMWGVETPAGFNALAVQILPRMNQSFDDDLSF